MPMSWLGVPSWLSILGFHGYSGIPGIYNAHVMARGTPWQSICYAYNGYETIMALFKFGGQTKISQATRLFILVYIYMHLYNYIYVAMYVCNAYIGITGY